MRAETSRQWSNALLEPACERAQLLISRHIDHELSADDTIALRAHLGACGRCQKALEVQTSQCAELAEALKSLWPGTAADEPTKKLCAQHEAAQKGRRNTLRAASFVLVLAAACVFASSAWAPKDSVAENEAGTSTPETLPANDLKAKADLALRK